MPMQVKEVWAWCLEHWSVVLFVLGAFVEFTPAIKLSPLKSALKWIGKSLNAGVIARLDDVDTRLDQQGKSIDENEMDSIRWEVLDFANACRNGIRHTKDEFQHIITRNEKYHHLLEKYGMENGVFDTEYDYILELYQRCQHENDFL